jgi:hypothetical protein
MTTALTCENYISDNLVNFDFEAPNAAEMCGVALDRDIEGAGAKYTHTHMHIHTHTHNYRRERNVCTG